MDKKKCTTGTHEGKIHGALCVGDTLVFSGTNREEVASLFFEHTENIHVSHTLLFEEHCKKIFFLRAEHFSTLNMPITVHIKKNAEVYFLILAQSKKGSRGKLRIRGACEENGILQTTIIHTNMGDMDIDVSVELRGREGKSFLRHIHIGGGKGVANVTLQNISQYSHTHGDIQTRCILGGNAKSSICGIPTVVFGAEECVSHLRQKTILLSPTARSISVPMLRIANNRVEASHASSFLHLTVEDEFYLRSRGIEEKNIADMLLHGMLHELLRDIPDQSLTRCISETSYSFLHNIA